MISLGLRSVSDAGGGAVFGAAAALDAGVGLEADQLREVCAGDEAEVFIACEWRDLAEAAAGEEDGEGAEQQVKVLGVGNDGKEDEERQGVKPPEDSCGGAGGGGEEGGQVGGHEGEDEQGDEAGFPGELGAEPLGS
jgi:hypothetical protein